MIVGLLAGIGAGALWGLTFVAPRAVEPFGTIDIAAARYLVFGAASLALMAIPAFRPTGLPRRMVAIGLFLGVVGYVAYFVAAANAVRLAGPAAPPLIIGALPILLAIVGNARDKTVRWSRLALPMALVAGGLALVNAAALASPPASARAQADVLLGIGWAVCALLVWMVYAIVNARVMREADAPDGLAWTGLQGLGAALGALPLLPFVDLVGPGTPGVLLDPEFGRFAAWALALGLAGSWLSTWFWVIASRRLPLALSAQLIVGETLFALLYGFLYEARFPTAAEAGGAAAQIAGVALAIEAFRRARAQAMRERAAPARLA